MGLPEVADFARNFAVMVRVQGPDPRGLKMRTQAFHHYNCSSGRTTLSASGMLFMGSHRDKISSGTVFVLTVASVIEPFLSQQYRDNAVQDKAYLIQGAKIDILVEGKSDAEDNDNRPDKESLPWLPAELIGIVSILFNTGGIRIQVDIPQSSAAVQSLIEAFCGLMENAWEVGWFLASHSRGPQHIIGNSLHRDIVVTLAWEDCVPVQLVQLVPGLLCQYLYVQEVLGSNLGKVKASVPELEKSYE